MSAGAPTGARGYVVSWRLAGRRVVVVGGGPVAEAKVTGLLDSGAEMVVVAPEVVPRLAALAEAGAIVWVRRRVRRRHLGQAALVVAATASETTNARVYRHGRRAGALVNVVDDPGRCDVTVPAVLRRGPATVAVTTDGASPAAARFLREHLEKVLPPGLGEVVAQAGKARAELRDQGRYRYDYYAWKQRFFEPAMEAITAGRGPGAVEELARRLVAAFDLAAPLRPGRLRVVGAGPGDPDLMTVRAARLLADADVVVHDGSVAEAVLALAPAAALRLAAGNLGGGEAGGGEAGGGEVEQAVFEHVRAGASVVVLTGGDPSAVGRSIEALPDLAAAGVGVEVVPGVSVTVAPPSIS